MMLLDLRNGLVGKDDPASHAASPLSHDGLAGKGFNGGVLLLVLRQVEIAQGNIQRVIERQLLVGDWPREAHGGRLRNCAESCRMETRDCQHGFRLGPGWVLPKGVAGTSRPFEVWPRRHWNPRFAAVLASCPHTEREKRDDQFKTFGGGSDPFQRACRLCGG